MNAYDEMYLNDAMNCLGEAMDYSVNNCNMNMDEFLNLFISSGYASQFEVGVSKIISGKSGSELVMDIFFDVGLKKNFDSPDINYNYSIEFWCGYILAYYQWYSKRPFKDIKKYISMKDIEKMYSTLHEVSENKFVDVVNSIIASKKKPTRLQVQRKLIGYTQQMLADKSGISLRTLQQYEIRSKDINKAASMTLSTLANVLGCQIEDLLEY